MFTSIWVGQEKRYVGRTRSVFLIFCPHIPPALLPGARLSSPPCPCLVRLCNWRRYVNSLPVAYRPSEFRYILTHIPRQEMQYMFPVYSGGEGITTKLGFALKNHVRMLEKASQKPRGTLWVWPDHRDYCSALPGLLHPNNWRLQLVKAPLRKLGASQPPPARCKLPSAFVSVPPSSSHTGASCSRVRRRDNRNMGQSWWASILKAALDVAPG